MLYTVKQLAKLAGVSIRTLHYYDQIGLLKPGLVKPNGYRYYQENELLVLQQILFFKELEFPLAEIKMILLSPGFDRAKALADQKRLIYLKIKRLNNILRTINRSIKNMDNKKTITEEELWSDFSKNEVESIKREVREKYDPKLVKQSRERMMNLTKEAFERVKAEGGEITVKIAENMDKGPDSEIVQAQVGRYFQYMQNFYDCSLDIFRGLGEMYVADKRFTAFYEKIRPGLAEFMRDAMAIYCDRQEKK